MGAVTQQEFDQMAAKFQEQAKTTGNVAALKLLGDMYYQGPSGTEKNVAAALPWWKQAVDRGDYSLAPKVAYAYLNGDGGETNKKLALHYFKISADRADNMDSQYTLGLMYENGIGCHANKRKAIPYYEQAALKGHAKAQWQLGMLLFTMKKDDGLHWMCCAHLSGIEDATDTLNHFITNGNHGEVIHHEIAKIKRNGIDPGGRRHEYNRELGILLSVLKWGLIGFFVAMISVLIVCGFILQMEHFPILLVVLIIGLFCYLGYWWEEN